MSVFVRRFNIFNPLRIHIRNVQSNAELIENIGNIHNRNPRNLEMIRIGHKPTGYHLEKTSPNYWHQVSVIRSTKFVTLEVKHFENGTVVSASSKEWPIRKRLYQAKDSAAYINLGRILAERCLESGIFCVRKDPELPECEKINLAMTELENNGVKLQEPDRYVKPQPWDRWRPDKPWEVHED